ncbi:hypothetical protein NPIL_592861, partial [Nephila pilipes]
TVDKYQRITASENVLQEYQHGSMDPHPNLVTIVKPWKWCGPEIAIKCLPGLELKGH